MVGEQFRISRANTALLGAGNGMPGNNICGQGAEHRLHIRDKTGLGATHVGQQGIF